MRTNKLFIILNGFRRFIYGIKSCGGNVKKTYSAPPPMTIDPKQNVYCLPIKTNYGDIVVQLLPKMRLLPLIILYSWRNRVFTTA